ncbi:MAG: hypothetical protein JXA21_13005 [Anaerolineae bacterium]|nr:hypothetical protein [Anaerolineae bacterium]
MTYSDGEIQYCQWHPKVETTLRCYQCGAPICVRCARRTPVGYLCPDCIRGRQQRYEQFTTRDYILDGVIAGLLGFLVSFLPLVGWFVLILSPLSGIGIAEVVRRVLKQRYGVRMGLVTAIGILAGCLPISLLILLASVGAAAASETGILINLLWLVFHLSLSAVAAALWFRLY